MTSINPMPTQSLPGGLVPALGPIETDIGKGQHNTQAPKPK